MVPRVRGNGQVRTLALSNIRDDSWSCQVSMSKFWRHFWFSKSAHRTQAAGQLGLITRLRRVLNLSDTSILSSSSVRIACARACQLRLGLFPFSV